MQALQTTYTSKVEVKSRSLGVLFLESKEEINKLIGELTTFDRVLEKLQSGLLDRERTFVRRNRRINC